MSKSAKKKKAARKPGRPRKDTARRTKTLAIRFTASEARKIEICREAIPDWLHDTIVDAAEQTISVDLG